MPIPPCWTTTPVKRAPLIRLCQVFRRARRALYFRESSASGKPIQCASCHTANPRQPGKTPAFRQIEPLAPVANPMRFTDAKKVEKWFRRNCDDVFRRECSAQEKGDFVRWLSSCHKSRSQKPSWRCCPTLLYYLYCLRSCA